MSAAVLAPVLAPVSARAALKAERRLGRGALRTYAFLLNAGGWWDMRELCQSLEVTHCVSLLPQLRVLLERKHIARRGAGRAGDPYEFGVPTSCVPVPGVSLQTTGSDAVH